MSDRLPLLLLRFCSKLGETVVIHFVWHRSFRMLGQP